MIRFTLIFLCLFITLSVLTGCGLLGNRNLSDKSQDTAPAVSSAEISNTQSTLNTDDYIGLWQTSPVVGSGYSERLALNSDGTFHMAASEMDGITRERFQYGSWSVEGSMLKLNVIEQIVWEGGRIEFDPVFNADIIVDPVNSIKAISEVFTFELSIVTADAEANNKRTFTAGDTKYWSLAAEPDSLQIDYDNARELAISGGYSDSGFDTKSKAENSGSSLSDYEKEVLELAENTLALLINEDWGALGHMVHPTQGLTFSPYGYVSTDSAVCLGMGDVISLREDSTVRNWGSYDGSGEPITCTINEYYDRFIMSHDFSKAQQIGVDRIIRTTSENNLYVFGNGCTFVDFHCPGVPDPEFGWASLRLVFSWYSGDDRYEGGLYLVAIVHDQWVI